MLFATTTNVSVVEGSHLSELLADPETAFGLDSISDQFDQVASVLREKKDRLALIEALKAQVHLEKLISRFDRDALFLGRIFASLWRLAEGEDGVARCG